MSPKKMLADVDDVVQLRTKFKELTELFTELGFTRDEAAALIASWIDMYIEREDG